DGRLPLVPRHEAVDLCFRGSCRTVGIVGTLVDAQIGAVPIASGPDNAPSAIGQGGHLSLELVSRAAVTDVGHASLERSVAVDDVWLEVAVPVPVHHPAAVGKRDYLLASRNKIGDPDFAAVFCTVLIIDLLKDGEVFVGT